MKKTIKKKKTPVKKKTTARKKPVKSRKSKVPAKKVKKTKLARSARAYGVVKTARLKKIGKVTHYFNHIKVAVLKLGSPLSLGQKINFQGATTDFSQTVSSMQIDHVQVKKAPKGKSIGLKVPKRVREGDLVFLA